MIQARPKLAYEIFWGTIGTWPTFQKNHCKIYKMFAKDGQGEQIFQLSNILSAELSATVMSFSVAQDGAAKAMRYLNDRFNSLHLLLTKVKQQDKRVFPGAESEPGSPSRRKTAAPRRINQCT